MSCCQESTFPGGKEISLSVAAKRLRISSRYASVAKPGKQRAGLGTQHVMHVCREARWKSTMTRFLQKGETCPMSMIGSVEPSRRFADDCSAIPLKDAAKQLWRGKSARQQTRRSSSNLCCEVSTYSASSRSTPDQDLLLLPESARSAGRTVRMRCLPGIRMPPTGLLTSQIPGRLHAGWPAQIATQTMGACASWRAATSKPS